VDWEWLRRVEIKRDEVGHASVKRWENLVGDKKVVGLRVQECRPSSALESSRLGQPFSKGSDQDARCRGQCVAIGLVAEELDESPAPKSPGDLARPTLARPVMVAEKAFGPFPGLDVDRRSWEGGDFAEKIRLQEEAAAVDLLGLTFFALESPDCLHNESVLRTEEGLDGDTGNDELGPAALGKKESRAIQKCVFQMGQRNRRTFKRSERHPGEQLVPSETIARWDDFRTIINLLRSNPP
jgi:hypothetical protein